MFSQTIKLLLMSKFIQTETKPEIVKVSVEPTILVGDGTDKVKSLVDGSNIEKDKKIMQFAVTIDPTIIKKLEKADINLKSYPSKKTNLDKKTVFEHSGILAMILKIDDKKDDDKTQVFTIDLGKKGDNLLSLREEYQNIEKQLSNADGEAKKKLQARLDSLNIIWEGISAVNDIKSDSRGFNFIISPQKIKSMEKEKPLELYTKYFTVKEDSLEEIDGSQLILPEDQQKSLFSGWVLYLFIGCVGIIGGGLILYFALKKDITHE